MASSLDHIRKIDEFVLTNDLTHGTMISAVHDTISFDDAALPSATTYILLIYNSKFNSGNIGSIERDNSLKVNWAKIAKPIKFQVSFNCALRRSKIYLI